MKICGYIVLRKPEENYDANSAAPYFLPDIPPQIEGGVTYSGIVRVPWFELEEGYYSGELSNSFVNLRKELIDINQPNLDIMVFKDLVKAKMLLEHSNAIQQRYELAVVSSEKLSRMKGAVESEVEISWLGLEPYCYGYGSVLLQGLYLHPQLFGDFISKINKHGLFDDMDATVEYMNVYDALALENNLEPIPYEPQLRDVLRIGRCIAC